MPPLDPSAVLLVVIIFFAMFTQSLTGFGSGLVSMALLPAIMGIRTAAPLVALVAATLEFTLLFRYRGAISLRSIWRLLLGALVGIPLGIIFLRNVDEKLVLSLLGIVLMGYGLYALLNLQMPELKQPLWGFGFGFVAGLLGGAYNTSGPPVIIYGNSRRWPPAEFKGNLQGFFVLNDVIVIASHALSQNFTPGVWQSYGLALPAVALGLAAGLALDRFLNPERFRKIVLWLLVVLGLRMLF